MPREVKAYKCKYCNAVSLDPGQAAEAEATCPHNPELACCANCAHLQISMTPRFKNLSYPVKVCAMPPDEGLAFEPPHNLGWCPNWERSPTFERSAKK